MKKFILLISCVLIIIFSFSLISCENNTKAPKQNSVISPVDPTATINELWRGAEYSEDTELGEGNNTIKINIEVSTGRVTLTLHTNQNNLKSALEEFNLINGHENSGLYYVDTVNGMTADYDKDKSYWQIFDNGNLSPVGISDIEISNGNEYTFVYTEDK